MTKEEFILLMVNYNNMECVHRSASNTTDFLNKVARDMQRGYLKCNRCKGTGKNDWSGHWRWSGKRNKSIWIVQKPISDKCSKCKGTGKIKYTLKAVKEMLDF